MARKHTCSACKFSSLRQRNPVFLPCTGYCNLYTESLPVVVSSLGSKDDSSLVLSWPLGSLFSPSFPFLWFRRTPWKESLEGLPGIIQRSLRPTSSFLFFFYLEKGFPHLQDSKRIAITLQCLLQATTCSITFCSFSLRIPAREVKIQWQLNCFSPPCSSARQK